MNKVKKNLRNINMISILEILNLIKKKKIIIISIIVIPMILTFLVSNFFIPKKKISTVKISRGAFIPQDIYDIGLLNADEYILDDSVPRKLKITNLFYRQLEQIFNKELISEFLKNNNEDEIVKNNLQFIIRNDSYILKYIYPYKNNEYEVLMNLVYFILLETYKKSFNKIDILVNDEISKYLRHHKRALEIANSAGLVDSKELIVGDISNSSLYLRGSKVLEKLILFMEADLKTLDINKKNKFSKINRNNLQESYYEIFDDIHEDLVILKSRKDNFKTLPDKKKLFIISFFIGIFLSFLYVFFMSVFLIVKKKSL